MKWSALILVAVLIAQPCPAQSILNEKWNFDTGEEPDHVYVLNVNDNPSQEIIVDSKKSGRVFAVDWSGTEVWRYSVPGLVFDLYAKEFEDHRGEIIVGSFTRAYSINQNGESNWKYFTQHNDVVSVFLDDLDGDGKGEAVIGSISWRGNAVIALESDSSDIMTYGVTRMVYPYIFESLDVDGDHRKEVAMGFTGYSMNTQTQSYDLGFVKPSVVKVVGLSGDDKWSLPTAGGVRSLRTADVNGDSLTELVVGSKNILYVLDRRGNLLWDYATGDLVYDLDFADVDGDNKTEVIAGSDKIYVLKDDGTLAWESKKYAGVFAVKAADLDGDNIPEVIAGSTRVVVYNNKGELVWSSPDVREVTDIAVADLDRNGYVEVVVSSEDGKVRSFETEPYAKRKKADRILSDARRAYNKADYTGAQETALKAKILFQELSDAKKMGEADGLLVNSRDHYDADVAYNESVAAYASGEYGKAYESASKASAIYSRLKDAQALSEVRRIYEGSRIRPDADGNYSEAIRLAEAGDYANASQSARRAASAYASINETELAGRAENLTLSFEKQVEADDYYGKAEMLYTKKRFPEASVYLDQAMTIYANLNDSDGIRNVRTLEAKIKDTGTVKNVFIVGGVGTVIIILIGLILVAVFLYLRTSQNKSKGELSDLNQKGT